ncbi:MAG: hypothetical protein U9P80_03750 [Thermodesulfobacteriota bacterium]|nr:hypothetical protein [Thermodesulfobacteriota bacterium]
MDSEEDAKKVLIQKKHDMHEEFLSSAIKDLRYNLDHYGKTRNDMEAVSAHVRANARALLFLCEERKRDRDKRLSDYSAAPSFLPSSGEDLK